MNDDKAKKFEEEVVLQQSTSGHYCSDILPIFTSNNKCQEVLVLETNLPYKEKLSQITKIHKQFGHASSVSMEKILTVNAKIIKNFVKKCSTCLKFKCLPPQPAVAFSKANDFNQTASVESNCII